VKNLRYIAVQIFNDKVVCTDAYNEELGSNMLSKLGIGIKKFKVLNHG